MIASLLVGLVVGFVLSIPPGPISVAVIKHGLQGDHRKGAMIGLGAALMDVLYALATGFASSAIVTSLKQLVNGNGWFELVFQVVCIGALLYLGHRYFQARVEDMEQSTLKEQEREARAKSLGFSSPVILGLLLGVTNLANPSFLPSLVTVAGFLHTQHLIESGFTGSLFYGIGFGVGVFLWFLALLEILIRLRKRLPARSFRWIFRVAGASMYLFAAILVVRVAVGTDWRKLFEP